MLLAKLTDKPNFGCRNTPISDDSFPSRAPTAPNCIQKPTTAAQQDLNPKTAGLSPQMPIQQSNHTQQSHTFRILKYNIIPIPGSQVLVVGF
jgi:hypothetical protein